MFKLVFGLSFIHVLCFRVFVATMVKMTRYIASFLFSVRAIVYVDLRRIPTRNSRCDGVITIFVFGRHKQVEVVGTKLVYNFYQ